MIIKKCNDEVTKIGYGAIFKANGEVVSELTTITIENRFDCRFECLMDFFKDSVYDMIVSRQIEKTEDPINCELVLVKKNYINETDHYCEYQTIINQKIIVSPDCDNIPRGYIGF